jgi:putative membrane protein
MTEKNRKPQAFDLSSAQDAEPDPNKGRPDSKSRVSTGDKPKKQSTAQKRNPRAPQVLEAPEDIFEDTYFEEDDTASSLVPAISRSHTMPKRFAWGTVLLSAVAGLFSLWAGVTATQLIEELFARSEILGWIGTGLFVLVLFAAFAIITREVFGLWRLKKLGTTQRDAARAISADDATAAAATMTDLRSIYDGRADMRWGLNRLQEHDQAIMDPADRIKLAERDLMVPLDLEANRIVARAARRVSVMTAVAPAALDIPLVGAQNLRMLRELAALYGGRPGTLGTIKLAKMVAGHLAVTGGIALSDGLISQLIGHGLVGRLSARFGEGAVNGILTARIGLAAIDLCRPLPFLTQTKPGLAGFMREVVRFAEAETSPGDGNPPAKDKNREPHRRL